MTNIIWDSMWLRRPGTGRGDGGRHPAMVVQEEDEEAEQAQLGRDEECAADADQKSRDAIKTGGAQTRRK